MERFYLWRSLEQDADHGTFEILTICYNSCGLDVDNVYRDIEKALKSRENLPDCVYIIGDKKQCAIYKDAWSSKTPSKESMLMRGMKFGLDIVKQYVFLEWQDTDFVQNLLGSNTKIYESDPKLLLKKGMYSLLDKNNAIHQAPSGHAFRHPSGNINKLFIQAREIARDEAELFVVGYAIASSYGVKLRDAKKIFVDTMGIYAYVKNALDICGGHAEILSFHSYDELKKLYPPSVPYLCIVSASTSGRMAKTMVERQFLEAQIATLVDITSSGRCGSVMIPLDKMDVRFPDLEAREGTLIEMIGENFTSKAKPPRPVLIALPHAPCALNDIHKYLGFSIKPFNSTIEGRSKLLQVDALPILEDKDFQRWLDVEINWSFPLAISHVIYANDETSRLLAGEILDRLKVRLAKGDEIKLISYKDLETSDCKDATGVVVVSAVSRDGGVLREISRDLRSYINAEVPRHFITPIGIPQNSASWKQLEIFLTKNPTSRSYGFSNWIQMPIGDDSEKNVWTCLGDLGSIAQGLDANETDLTSKIDQKIIAESLEMAATEIGNSYRSLLNSPRGNPLVLSEGFLFFEKDSTIAKRYSEVDQSVIYLTISAVLQCAREHKDHTKKLCPTGYESVVLAPECFLRFNDAVLQACLLRASLPSELDYSASPELSKLMRELLSKIFIRSDKNFGDAALEFAASLAIGSLRLTRGDIDAIFNEFFTSAKKPSALLGLLILAKWKQG
jgi:hypothetical protein